MNFSGCVLSLCDRRANEGLTADQAGIRAGDSSNTSDARLIEIFRSMTRSNFLNGAAGSEVKLRVLRANSRPLTLTVKRGAFRAPAAEARMEAGRIGVLRINSFAAGEAADARARLQDLIKQGAQKLVVDLRGTAGGSIDEAVAVLSVYQRRHCCSNLGREARV